MKKMNNIITSIVFVAFIGIFFLITALKPQRNFSQTENRYLAKKPDFTWKTLLSGEFATDYEEYLSDQFVLRDKWITLKTQSELMIGKNQVNGVYFAADNYLIENAAINDEELMYRNEQRLIEFIQQHDNARAMIVPTAAMILSEKLPVYAEVFNQNEVIDAIKAETGEQFIDVRQVLEDHDNEYIYYRTDHHWTTLGAYYAYVQWAQSIGLTPYALEDFQVEEASRSFLGTLYSKVNMVTSYDTIDLYHLEGMEYEVVYNMQDMEDTLYMRKYLDEKDKYSVYLGGNNAMVEVNTNVDNDRVLLIIKDSYAHCFAPFAVNHFAKTVMIDFRYLKMPLSQVIEEYGVTDILVLYNTIHFSNDTNMSMFEY